MTGLVFVCTCTVRRLRTLVFWATATVWVLDERDCEDRLLYFLAIASSIGRPVWRLGKVLSVVCLCRSRGAGGGDEGLGVDLGSTSVTLVICCRSSGIVEGDPASFQTWKIAPSIKPGSTDWTPVDARKVNSGVLCYRADSLLTRQTLQQDIHAIQRQLVTVAESEGKSCDIKLEEEKWCETNENVG